MCRLKQKVKKWISRFRKPEIERLRDRGVEIGENVNIYGGTIDYLHGHLVKIGDNVTISHATILAHDASTKMYLGYSKIGKVIIGDNVFIGYGSIILPGIKIGNDVIVGAGSVVREDIPDNCVVAGNPAVVICQTDTYIKKNEARMGNSEVFHTPGDKKTKEEKEYIKNSLKPGMIGYDI